MAADVTSTDKKTEELIEKYSAMPHPKTSELPTMALLLLTGFIGAIIGMELMVSAGVTANTSIIGALCAVLIGLIPFKCFERFKNIHRQNIIETGISASTFAAGNMIFFALAIVWIVDKTLLTPMMIGASAAIILDVLMMYWLFDTPVMPATGTWGPGVATSETIISAAEGGKRALIMVASGIVGAIGQAFRIPMDIFGICFLGNPWALLMFGVGLLLRAYSPQLFDIDLAALYVPHGVMIGGGLVAIYQVIRALSKKNPPNGTQAEAGAGDPLPTRTNEHTRKSLGIGVSLYLVVATGLAVAGGLYFEMSTPALVGWIVYVALTSVMAELLVGAAAMNAGWFPSAPIALLFVIVGILLGFDTRPLILLAGFKLCAGPAFADMGYDLKAGWILRGRGKHREFEIEGRKQQLYAELVGAGMGIAMVVFLHASYFGRDLFPPSARVFAATIQAASDPSIIKSLLIWGVVGGIIQLLGGPQRQMGILLATGLLIYNPRGGFAVLAALAIRYALRRKFGGKEENTLYICAAGFIAGASLYSFFKSTIGALTIKR